MGYLGIYRYVFSLGCPFLFLLLLLMPDCSKSQSQKEYLGMDEICQKYSEIHGRIYEKAVYECAGAIFIFRRLPEQDFESFIQKNKDMFSEFCRARISEMKKSVERKSVSYDGAKAYQYIKNAQDLLSESCENFSKRSHLVKLYENLNGVFGREVFSGILSDGQDCYNKNECKEGLYCGGKSCPGVCMPLGKQGDKCNSHSECEKGLVCYSSVCTSTAATPCRSSSDCSPPQLCFDGVCTLFKEKGENCEKPEECEYSCDLQNKRCIQYKFADYGKPCGQIGDDSVYCLSGECVTKENVSLCEPYGKENEKCFQKFCDKGLFCSAEGVCLKLSKEGQPCGSSCGYGLYCDNGICKKKKEVGDVCISDQECKTDLCSEGKCFDKRQNVKACNEDSDCLNWNCLNNNCCSIQ